MDNLTDLPNSDGFFGEYGGKFVPETLMHALKELDETYGKLKNSPKFIEEIDQDLLTLRNPINAEKFRDQHFNKKGYDTIERYKSVERYRS